MRKIIIFVSVCLIGILTGCATIFKGGLQNISFNSDPKGATVLVNGIDRGKTPLQLQLKPNTTYNFTFKKEGCEDKNYVLNNHIEALWIILDIVPGGLLGPIPIIIDAATGNWYKLDESYINLPLEKK